MGKNKTSLLVRGSEFMDYIAVDLIDDSTNKILSTPLYLQKGKTVNVKSYDEEQGKWFKTELTYDGKTIYAKDIDPLSDSEGLEFEVGPTDLIDTKQFKL